MPNVVIDSSVAVKWFVAEPYSAEARRILGEYQTGMLNFLAPDLIYAEVGNIVWKKHRFQGLAAADARAIIQAFLGLRFSLTPTADLLADAYPLAVTHQRSVYDAMYLALSVREGCRFVTADEKLVNAVSGAFPDVIWLGSWS
jgi:predicted nucleic acid-binding protein